MTGELFRPHVAPISYWRALEEQRHHVGTYVTPTYILHFCCHHCGMCGDPHYDPCADCEDEWKAATLNRIFGSALTAADVRQSLPGLPAPAVPRCPLTDS